jgi:hypothetical protein
MGAELSYLLPFVVTIAQDDVNSINRLKISLLPGESRHRNANKSASSSGFK